MTGSSIGKEVFDFMKPRLDFVSHFVKKKDRASLRQIRSLIDSGLEKEYIHLGGPLDIDIKSLKKKNGKHWADLLKKNIGYLKLLTRF